MTTRVCLHEPERHVEMTPWLVESHGKKARWLVPCGEIAAASAFFFKVFRGRLAAMKKAKAPARGVKLYGAPSAWLLGSPTSLLNLDTR